MRAWVRWQDWVALVAGAYAAIATLWVEFTGETAGMIAVIVLGVLIVAAAATTLSRPGMVRSEYGTVVLGLLLFVTPFVFGFTDLSTAAWTAWITGAVATVASLAAVPASRQAGRELPAH